MKISPKDSSQVPIILVPSPSTIAPGGSTTITVGMGGTVTSDTTVYISSNNSGLSVPTSINVPTGANSAQFTATASAGASGTAQVSASCNGGGVSGNVTIS